MSPRFKRASPDANRVFDQATIILMGKGCYGKEKLSLRRSLDIYQKHEDYIFVNLLSCTFSESLKEIV